MSDDIAEEKFNEALRDLARDYNQPPMIVPRDAMWAAIVAGQRRKQPRAMIFVRRFASLAAAAVVLLAVGIGVGRVTAPHVLTPPTAASTRATSTVPDAYTVATAQQLVQAQALLTAFNASERDAKADAHLAAWARDLLSNTRLLLDSPAGQDPHRRQLLQDLELVLVQIAALSPDAATTDRDAIAQTLKDAQVLPRIKAAIPTSQVGL
jgi:hypothetical protein